MLGTRLNRSAVGKPGISFTNRRSQQLTQRSSLRTLLVPTRCAVLCSDVDTLGGRLDLVLHIAVAEHSSQKSPPAHLFNPLLRQTLCPSRLRPPPSLPQGRRGLG